MTLLLSLFLLVPQTTLSPQKSRSVLPFPTSHHKSPSLTAIPQSLCDALFVFIRHDGHQGPLRRCDKASRIMVGSREEIISTDRLKPAHIDLTGPVPVAQPPRRGRPPVPLAETTIQERPPELESSWPHQHCRSTRSGRAVRLPPRFR